eukprot:CAMPEP_0117045930 /NCGR_PEP_ID=MMETSP0472-20121206/31772_1 /TAXON_ID=693140 ORGANISM="Tiarina fusus, Strain LIS" /NCGR_SAMPLE_ID=MMETSP0472 /ASSEMBLY_ACC=CAM_ASM_000603 /LENGTH=291 /DNA_ID=CAMNT_0004758115 /DNA_START=62 /DNA_END=937 /DNA_ORIENTATION=-
MSLALANIKNLCSRKDGILTIDVVTGTLNKNEKGVYLVMAIVVPYSVDEKARKEGKGKKIADQKAAKGRVQTPTKSANPNVYWNSNHTLNISDLTTLNILQAECYQTRALGKSKLLGMLEIPIDEALVGGSKQSYDLFSAKEKTKTIGNIEFKLKLQPSAPGLEVVSLSSEKLESIPKFLFDSFWVPVYLKELNLTGCEITKIPPEITKFSLLATLNLSNNKLKEIPDFLLEMEHLTLLDVSANQITEVSDAILSSGLKSVNIIDNPLEDLSEDMIKSKKIRSNFVSVTPR